MTDRIAYAPQSRDPRDYESLQGGYSESDGSVRVSSGPTVAKSESKPALAGPAQPAPDGRAVKSLVDGAGKKRARPEARTAILERRAPDGTQLQLGATSSRSAAGGQLDERVAVVDATVPLSKSQAVNAQALAAKVYGGVDNADGSKGLNVGAGASVASIEWKYQSGSDSMSVGVDVGLSAGFSAGIRDSDGDGVPETCVSVDASVSVAMCVEPTVPRQKDGPADGARGTGSRVPQAGAGGTSGW
jgi:hypothetical protein